MCGIVGYIGKREAAPILLDGLERLAYRGYDSAGLAVRNQKNQIHIVKAKGKLENLINKTDAGKSINGLSGIGHTRWATHGEPSEINAHPHYSDDTMTVAVHNGIIENESEIREFLTSKGYHFYSATDTEVAVKLIDYYYQQEKISSIKAIQKAMHRIRGSYALAVMFKDLPDEIFAAKKDSPMIIGTANGESFLASDVPAILKYTRSVYYIDDLEIAGLKADSISFYNIDGEKIQKEKTQIEWDASAAEKGGYEHFMIKEIHEQPKAVTDTLHALIKEQKIDLSAAEISDEMLRQISQIYIFGCGSAYHVGMAAQYVLEDLAKIPVRVELASEFRYRNLHLDKNGLAVVISQSGETADSLAALREAKRQGVKTLGIVNVIGSSIAREADNVLFTLAGPEIAVATTKAYSTQLIVMDCLAIQCALARRQIDEQKYQDLISELLALPKKIEDVLNHKENIQKFAAKHAFSVKDIFFIGRGLDYAICLEGSLKMKEISYIHSEAYAAGEIKHGAISLIEEGTLLIGSLTQERLFEKTKSNMAECKSRGAFLMALTNYGNYAIEEISDFAFYLPKTDSHFSISLAIIPLQLLSYYVSALRGLDIDKPRNLAKSVTVE